MDICGDFGAFDFGDACVRGSWSAILPLLVVIVLCISSLQIPFQLPSAQQRLSAATKAPFVIIPIDGAQIDIEVSKVVPLWRSLFFVFAGLIQSLAWLASGVFYFGTVQCLLIAVSWLYTVVRPIAAPFATAPYDLFVLYIMHAVAPER
ncbi:hypothetical protein C8R43DRAFT_1141357 [Mycena crocata]|nr:hypothetical protein C8R43DRAFT_1141357 [Mycena crocata]